MKKRIFNKTNLIQPAIYGVLAVLILVPSARSYNYHIQFSELSLCVYSMLAPLLGYIMQVSFE